MADQEKFLERWSRRKRDAAVPQAEDAAQPADDVAAETHSEAETARGAHVSPGKTAAQEPAFDLSKLPSLDSITATTDIRPFLARGVPSELTRAALRRAWASDPAIRDFVGLQENDWDFNKPNAIAGFGDLPPGTDLKKMVADLFGDSKGGTEAPPVEAGPRQIPQAPQSPTEPSLSGSDVQAASEGRDDPELVATNKAEPESGQTEFVQDSKNIAAQNRNSVRRKHGSALPE